MEGHTTKHSFYTCARKCILRHHAYAHCSIVQRTRLFDTLCACTFDYNKQFRFPKIIFWPFSSRKNKILHRILLFRHIVLWKVFEHTTNKKQTYAWEIDNFIHYQTCRQCMVWTPWQRILQPKTQWPTISTNKIYHWTAQKLENTASYNTRYVYIRKSCFILYTLRNENTQKFSSMIVQIVAYWVLG